MKEGVSLSRTIDNLSREASALRTEVAIRDQEIETAHNQIDMLLPSIPRKTPEVGTYTVAGRLSLYRESPEYQEAMGTWM